VTELCLRARMFKMLLKHLHHSSELAPRSTTWDQVSGEHAQYDISWFFLRYIMHFILLLPNQLTTLKGSAGSYGFVYLFVSMCDLYLTDLPQCNEIFAVCVGEHLYYQHCSCAWPACFTCNGHP